jgi:hypothetical protein
MKFPPTSEQQAAIEAFTAGSNFVLEAGAGTGKTSTLQFLAEAAPGKRGVYVAFNNAIATEARRKFPRNMVVKTMHSFAMQGTRYEFMRRLNGSPKIPLGLAASRLGVFAPLQLGGRNPLRPTTQASLAMQTVRRFCSSDSETIRKRHVPMPDGMDPATYAFVAPRIVSLAERVWADVSDPNGDQFRLEHDHYLKVWALQRPRWNCDFVLFDEAQDANPVISGMVELQAAAGAQLVAVGDSAQSIYEWRGAVDALRKFDVTTRLRLTQSFRFGPEIANEANKWLKVMGSDFRLSGCDDKRSRVVDSIVRPDVILSRGNATVIAELFSALEAGTRVGLVGGGRDLLAVAKAAGLLKAGIHTEHPEFALFETWDDLVDYAESGDDPNLLVLVKIVEEHGAEAIVRAVQSALHEDDSDLVLSTAHKAKGKEWGSVRLSTDFAEPKFDEGRERFPGAEELRLSYVSVTRAMEYLDRGNLDWVDEALKKGLMATLRAPLGQGLNSVPTSRDRSAEPTTAGQLVTESVPEYVAAARLKNRNAYAKWTAEADSALASAFEGGASIKELAAEHGRTQGAIRSRLIKLGVLDDPAAVSASAAQSEDSTAVASRTAAVGVDSISRNEPVQVDYTWSSADWTPPDESEDDPWDADPWDDSEYRELQQEQRDILATFDYLMERDDI